jgi:CRISPR-associated endonuclease Csy4
MNYYLDIRVLPDQEFSPSLLMNALFAKFHRALVVAGHGKIGVSFPQAQKTLGDCIRLHGSQGALQRFMEISWLKGLTDYTCVTAITAVPDNCRYRVVKRMQAKSSVERMYRRSIRKGWLTTEEAETRMSDCKEQYLKLPFVQLKSHSSGQAFRLFIQQGELLDTPAGGEFSAYALSDVATIPWF